MQKLETIDNFLSKYLIINHDDIVQCIDVRDIYNFV